MPTFNVKRLDCTYLEQITGQNLKSLLRIFHAFQFGILIQHTLKYLQEKLQRELVQEMHLEEEQIIR